MNSDMTLDTVCTFHWDLLIHIHNSLVFHILLFSSISLHCLFKKAFLSLLAILWNSAFFPFLHCFSFLFFLQLFVKPIGKGVCQGCILSPCSLNFYSEHIMRNTRLNELKAGIKIARRNINNLSYADVTTLMVKSEENKTWLKTQH